MHKLKLSVAVVIAAIAGCAQRAQPRLEMDTGEAVVVTAVAGYAQRQQDIRRGDPERSFLNRDDSVYVAVPADAVYLGKTYRDSGQTTSEVLLSFFLLRSMKAERASSYQTFEDAKKTASDKSYRYLFYPTILRWEDRKSEWTGKTDHVEIEIEVVEASTGKVLDSSILNSKNDILGSGLERPQALLSRLFSDYVHGLFDTR